MKEIQCNAPNIMIIDISIALYLTLQIMLAVWFAVEAIISIYWQGRTHPLVLAMAGFVNCSISMIVMARMVG